MTHKGIKRFLLILMSVSVPFVSAEPVSVLQESSYYPSVSQMVPRAAETRTDVPRSFYGTASWYSEDDPAINIYTANGEIFDDSEKTCASWDFPFGTLLRVKNPANGKTVVCRVNDRGPAKRLERLIDLTKSAFGEIADLKKGLIRVEVTPVQIPARKNR